MPRQAGNRRPAAAQGAVRVAADLEFVKTAGQRIVHEHPAGQRFAQAEDQLQHLGGLERADHPGDGAEDSDLLAARDQPGRRRLGEQAAVAGVIVPVLPRPEGRDLALEAQQGAGDQRFACEKAGVVEQIAGREIVRAVDDDVVIRDQPFGVGRGQPLLDPDDRDFRIDGGQALRRAVHLGLPDPAGRVDDLALQVRQVDYVVVDHAQRADPGRGEILEHRCAEAAGADRQHPGGEQRLLPFLADLVENDVAGVAFELGVGDGHRAPQ